METVTPIRAALSPPEVTVPVTVFSWANPVIDSKIIPIGIRVKRRNFLIKKRLRLYNSYSFKRQDPVDLCEG
jgi:hypothetical protein